MLVLRAPKKLLPVSLVELLSQQVLHASALVRKFA